MLVKVGRPHSEVEHAVSEAAEREAERAYANVRWLNLCTAVTPLMGLLGTVWGMIVAFHQTTLLAPGQDRATQLAQGIYIALVTTLGGLMVAIPVGDPRPLFRNADHGPVSRNRRNAVQHDAVGRTVRRPRAVRPRRPATSRASPNCRRNCRSAGK